MSSYIIKDGVPIAELLFDAKSGPCRYAYHWCKEAIDANREKNLVNARNGRISNDKRWASVITRNNMIMPFARELNPGEYLIS